MELKQQLYAYIENPMSDANSYNIAITFYNQGHFASAMAYFLRCAEITESDDLIYKCLLLSANCLQNQGNRIYATKGLILHAIELLPKRPEAYHAYSRILEINKEWQECYTITKIALETCDFTLQPFFEVNYFGRPGLLFERAVSAWWVGRFIECKELFSDLYFNQEIPEWMMEIVRNNLTYLKMPLHLHTEYDKTMYDRLRFKFKGSDKIEKSYSQAYQDMFVLSVLNGKKKGKYLEIGSGHYAYGNNTYLLEKDFEWKGISVEIDPPLCEDFSSHRNNLVINGDARKLDYSKILESYDNDTNWDYLQVDCEPPSATYEVLGLIPFDKYKFAVITFEHDFYADDQKIFRELSRDFLKSKGYILLVNDIAPDKKSSFEDWWVHPDLVPADVIKKLRYLDLSKVTKSEDYMLSLKTNFKDIHDFAQQKYKK